MKNLWWKTVGVGNFHLVLLHGWGLNAGVWHSIQEQLSSQFTLHLMDLPGFGRSQACGALSLDEMVECVLKYAPQNGIWLGWSLGGLVASQAALTYPERVKALVTVSSSPCFSARKDWPGIRPELLNNFQQQLSDDLQHTIERFLSLQTSGTNTARQDARTLKRVVFSLPLTPVEVLKSGIEILKTTNLCEALTMLRHPHLRLYGYLDGLVPRKIIQRLDTLWPHSKSIVIANAAHAPFISHPTEFCSALIEFSQYLD